ncbi:MAG: hypothetical protein KatS3mg108_2015 [Isosphaeraceae bacterium]|jgi:hypothetical protein|nr:MAG: hypothetical protein KatS3mg108_2015 [Isosphaeraceae bacterium]
MTSEPNKRLVPWSGEMRHLVVCRLDAVRSYRVGELWRPGVTRWEPDAIYSLDRAGHSVTILEPDPSPALVQAVATTPAELALVVEGPLLVLLCRFGTKTPWFTLPYAWPLRNAGRALCYVPPARVPAGKGALLWVSLVDAASGLIVAQRGTVMSHRLTVALHRAIRTQIRSPFHPDRYIKAVSALDLDFLASRRLLARARCWSDSD